MFPSIEIQLDAPHPRSECAHLPLRSELNEQRAIDAMFSEAHDLGFERGVSQSEKRIRTIQRELNEAKAEIAAIRAPEKAT